MRRLQSGVLWGGVILAAAAAFLGLRRPYAAIFSAVAIGSLVQAFALGAKPSSRNVMLALASVLLGLAGMEVALQWLDERRYGSIEYSFEPPRAGRIGGWDPHWRPDPIVGYRPLADVRVRARKQLRGELVYDVSYGLDANGWRRVPGSDASAPAALLVFGGSFAFGEGLDDDQTLSQHLALGLRPGLGVHSFAFGGYGPQEMLAILENGLESEWLPEGLAPRQALYVAIPAHIARVAGYTSWNRFGPRYVLQDNSVVLAGAFSDEDWLPPWSHRFLMPSGLLRRLHYQRHNRPADAAHGRLFARVIERAAEVFAARHSGAELHVLLFSDARTPWPALALPPGRVHRAASALPADAWTTRRPAFFIPGDGHPTQRTNRAVASYLVKQALKP